MPSIEILRIFGDSSLESKEKLMKATPNVKTLLETLLMVDDEYADGYRTVEGSNLNSINGFHAVLNNLPKLEHFGWVISTLTPRDLLNELDVLITGLPKIFCYKMVEKYRERDSLSPVELVAYQLKRRSSSILDLKGKDLEQVDSIPTVHFTKPVSPK